MFSLNFERDASTQKPSRGPHFMIKQAQEKPFLLMPFSSVILYVLHLSSLDPVVVFLICTCFSLCLCVWVISIPSLFPVSYSLWAAFCDSLP